MLIDWVTVGAQIVNFLILLALLKVFLYDRIIRAMDQRQQRIRDRLADADDKRREAEQEAAGLREERQALAQRREQLLDEAKAAAERQRRQLEQAARREVDERRKFWERQLEKSQAELIRDLQKSAAEEVFAVTRDLLRDLADQPLENRISDVLVRRLGDLDNDQREALRKSLQDGGRPAVVRSVYPVPEDRRKKIESTLQEIAGAAVPIRYETDADLILGIELKTPGKKVAWHAGQYLDRLEDRAQAAIESRTEAENTRTKPEESQADDGE